MQAHVAAGQPFPARDDLHDDHVEGERGDRQVDALEAQRRQADDDADRGREQRRAGQRHHERHAAGLQQRLGVGADREEGRVAERDLPGEADEQHQPEADDRIDEDEVQLRQDVLAGDERRGEQHQAQQPVPEELPAVLEQADVLVVAGLEDEAHLRPSCAKSRRRCPKASPAAPAAPPRRRRRP